MRTLKGGRTLPCDNTVFDCARVKWNSAGTMVTLCGANDPAIGVCDGVPMTKSTFSSALYPSGLSCVVISTNTEDGVQMVAGGAISQNATVYAAAGGQILATGSLAVGYNNTANITAAGQKCDISPLSSIRNSTSVIAAAGTNAATAAQLNPGFNHVTGATGSSGVGVILPPGVDNLEVTVDNADAANAVLLVYPDGTHNIDALTSQAAIQLPAKSSVRFTFCGGTSLWYTTPKVPS